MHVGMSYQHAPVLRLSRHESRGKPLMARTHAERGVKLEISQTLPYARRPSLLEIAPATVSDSASWRPDFYR